jgi:alkylhydroperoxidase/carboxymuconolactone decarboxylase family protein YurZ
LTRRPGRYLAASASQQAQQWLGGDRRPEQLRGHIRRALDNGVTQEEIGEVFTRLAFYSGWPAL